MSQPSSILTLYANVPFRNDYKYVTSFTNANQLRAYLNSFNHQTFSDVMYIKRNQKYVISLPFDSVHDIYNYCAYYNPTKSAYEFAFIADVEWYSEESTCITIQYDVWNNNQFTASLGQCLIERSHIDRYDSNGIPIYNSLLPELDFEADKISSITQQNLSKDSGLIVCYAVFVFAEASVSGTGYSITGLKNGNACDAFYYMIIPFYMNNLSTQYGSYPTLTQLFNSEIISSPSLSRVMFTPYLGINGTISSCTLIISSVNYSCLTYDSSNALTPYVQYTTSLTADGKITLSNLSYSNTRSSAFEPKLFVYPYGYKQVEYGSVTQQLRNEFFYKTSIERTITLYIRHSLSNLGIAIETHTGSYTIDGDGYMYAERDLINSEFPIMTDPYENYLSAHSAVLLPQLFSIISGSVGKMVGSINPNNMASSMLSATGTAISGVGSTIEQYATLWNYKGQPKTERGKPNNLALAELTENVKSAIVKICTYTLNDTLKQLLFDYLYYYGYNISSYGIPQYKTRYYFNYIKTSGCIANGIADPEERAKYESIFNNGVFVYHFRYGSVQTYGECTLENKEMSLL